MLKGFGLEKKEEGMMPHGRLMRFTCWIGPRSPHHPILSPSCLSVCVFVCVLNGGYGMAIEGSSVTCTSMMVTMRARALFSKGVGEVVCTNSARRAK